MTFGHGVFDHMAAEDSGHGGSGGVFSRNRVGFQFNKEKCKEEYLVRFGLPKGKVSSKVTSSLDKALYYAQSTQYSSNPKVEITSWWSNDHDKIQSIYEDGKWKGTPITLRGRLSYGYYIVNQGKGKCSLMHDSTDLPHKPEDIAEPQEGVTHDEGKGQNEDWQEERCTPKPPTWSSFGAWSECNEGRYSNFSKEDNEKDAGFVMRSRTMVNPGKQCAGAYIAQEDIKTHEEKACCSDPNSTPTWSGSGDFESLKSQGFTPGGKMPKCKCKDGYQMNDDGMCEEKEAVVTETTQTDAEFCGDANAKKVNSDCVCKDGYTRAMTDDEWRTNNTGPNNSTCVKKEEETTTTTTTTPTTATVTTQSSTTTPVASEKKGDGKGLLTLALVGGLGVFAYQRRKRGK